MQNEAIFEAPAAHEAAHENHEIEAAYEDYSNPELEWEAHEASHYSAYSSPYSNPEAHELELEDESDRFLGGLLGGLANSLLGESEGEDESEMELEDESDRFLGGLLSGLVSEGESEDEGEYFFKKAFRAIKKVAKAVSPVAKMLAPIAAKTLVGMIPGVGAVAAPLAGKLVGQLVKEGEAEAEQLENHFTALFANNEVVSEASHEIAHEAALTELLAAEAALATTEAEAEAAIAATLPITIQIMGARQSLRPVMPVLTQANGRLVRTLRRQGPAGKQLLGTVPAINRRAVGTLKAAARRGQRITPPLAVQAMSAATRRVLGNPRLVKRAVKRNMGMRVRVAPLSPRRPAIYSPNALRRGAMPYNSGLRTNMYRPMSTGRVRMQAGLPRRNYMN